MTDSSGGCKISYLIEEEKFDELKATLINTLNNVMHLIEKNDTDGKMLDKSCLRQMLEIIIKIYQKRLIKVL